MDGEWRPRKPALTRVILIADQHVVIIDDVLRMVFRDHKSFSLVWAVCEALTENPEYQVWGGVPPKHLAEKCTSAESHWSRNEMNTRWRDGVEFRAGGNRSEADAEDMALKSLHIDVLRGDFRPYGISTERFAIDMLRSVFRRSDAPGGTPENDTSELFSVRAMPSEIWLFKTTAEAEARGIKKSGVSEATKYRIATWQIAYLYWKQRAEIDRTGRRRMTASVKVMNLASHPLRRHGIFLWASTEHLSKKPDAKAWLADRTALYGEFSVGKATGYERVSLEVFFPSPLMPGEALAFSFSFAPPGRVLPGLYCQPVFLEYTCRVLQLELFFADPWCVDGSMVLRGEGERDAIQPTLLAANHLRWRRFFPEPASRRELRLQLSRTTKILSRRPRQG